MKPDTGLDSISVFDLADLRRNNVAHVVLDVREAAELAVCELQNAMHIPMAQVRERADELPRDMPVVVMCHHGMRSLRVVQMLRNEGWQNAVNLEGGIDAWASQVDPAMPRY